LKDLNISGTDQLTCFKQMANYGKKKYPLLTDDKENFTTKAKEVFTQIFLSHAIEGEVVINAETGETQRQMVF
jgi:hypothetical protein